MHGDWNIYQRRELPGGTQLYEKAQNAPPQTDKKTMAKKFDLSGLRVPEHVAIILDGNGRWAKKHHVPKNVGHSKGSDNVEKIVEAVWVSDKQVELNLEGGKEYIFG